MVDQPKATLTPASPPQKSPDVVAVPKEYFSKGNAIQVRIEGDQITLMFDPVIVQEIGAYHRCKVRVQFKEGQGPLIIPATPMP